MNFWSTVAGQRLANALTVELPKLVTEMRELRADLKVHKIKKQEVVSIPRYEIKQYLQNQLNANMRFVGSIDENDSFVVIITEEI